MGIDRKTHEEKLAAALKWYDDSVYGGIRYVANSAAAHGDVSDFVEEKPKRRNIVTDDEYEPGVDTELPVEGALSRLDLK